ncbi:Type III restriction-modification system methylation subunit [uncultured Candidatus Thioglobus sp.]|nr:Type III restriction-modification system methylation subunit [uncultured Candidatus Thioglobus sp.]
MAKRLKLAKNLLTEDGVIFISIDDNEQAQLKLLCDEIFNEKNFIANFIWKKRTTGGHDSKDVNTTHEYITCFCINSSIRGDILQLLDSGKEYPEFDPINNKSFKWDSLWTVSHGYTKNCDYPILAPDGTEVFPYMCHGKGVEVNGIARWFWSFETYQKNNKTLKISEVKNKWKVYKKVFSGKGTPIQSRISKNEIGGTSEGKSNLKELFNNNIVFENPKPVKLVQHFLNRKQKNLSF